MGALTQLLRMPVSKIVYVVTTRAHLIQNYDHSNWKSDNGFTTRDPIQSFKKHFSVCSLYICTYFYWYFNFRLMSSALSFFFKHFTISSKPAHSHVLFPSVPVQGALKRSRRTRYPLRRMVQARPHWTGLFERFILRMNGLVCILSIWPTAVNWCLNLNLSVAYPQCSGAVDTDMCAYPSLVIRFCYFLSDSCILFRSEWRYCAG